MCGMVSPVSFQGAFHEKVVIRLHLSLCSSKIVINAQELLIDGF